MAATAGARVRARMQPAVEPNVIPFIDVLLVLLIIFMVTAPKPTTDLRLDLAQAGPSLARFLEPTVVDIREGPGGYRVFVGDAETTIEHVATRTFEHIMSADPALVREDVLREGRVFIRADLDVAYQNVVSVTDQLQSEGFEKVAMAAQNADEEEAPGTIRKSAPSRFGASFLGADAGKWQTTISAPFAIIGRKRCARPTAIYRRRLGSGESRVSGQ